MNDAFARNYGLFWSDGRVAFGLQVLRHASAGMHDPVEIVLLADGSSNRQVGGSGACHVS